MRNFRYIIFVLILVAIVAQILFMKEDASKNSEAPINTKLMISLSTFSLYDIAKHIGGDTVELVMIMPFGVDAHSFEPTPKLMTKIHDSSLVIYSGAGLEPWIKGFDFKNLTVDMSQHVKLRKLGIGEHHEHGDEEPSHNNGTDPHYWLDIDNMISAANVITGELIKILPSNEELYVKSRDSYIEMLKKLDSDYKNEFLTCKSDTIIVNHNAFSYLADRYGFHIESLSGLSPEAEPSAKSMANLIEHIKEHNVSTIFFESFASDRAIKSIAEEANASVDVLQPIGNITADEAKQNLSFEDIMRLNLTKISKALDCK
ncbi:zinc transport system substrate-binding protein [Epsilonproteobacteria bacterium SCGC AD-311-C15]|nr:zinc transport system substrate-binding protein [Epsilonproteobacteria bacterium SCGC AD-311-C15]